MKTIPFNLPRKPLNVLFLTGLFLCLIHPLLLSQTRPSPTITDLKILLPPDQDLSQTNSIIPVFVATLSDGKTKSTNGNFHRFLSLNTYHIQVDNGKWYKQGHMITYRHSDVWANGGDIKITLTEKHAPKRKFVFPIHIPYPVSWEATYEIPKEFSPADEIPIHLSITFSDGTISSSKDIENRLNWPHWRLFDLQSNATLRPNKSIVLPYRQTSEHHDVWVEAILRYNRATASPIVDNPMDYHGIQRFDFRGQDGSTTTLAEDGQDVHIYMRRVKVDNDYLIQVRIQGEADNHDTYLNPDGGKLYIDCQGGKGADGKPGMNGKNGRNATRNSPATSGENGGNGEAGYEGGHGGCVFFFLDKESEAFLHLFQINNQGGKGGQGGAGGFGGKGGIWANHGHPGRSGVDGLDGKKGSRLEVKVISKKAMEIFFDSEYGFY